tara:strand:- start:592 stop:1047 length:456 start_codon:yes stop_codon:yes gene_type:complete
MKAMTEEQAAKFGNTRQGIGPTRGDLVFIQSFEDYTNGLYLLVRKDEESGNWELCKFNSFRQSEQQGVSIFWDANDGVMSVSGGPWEMFKGPFEASEARRPIKAWNWMDQTPGEQKGHTFEYSACLWFGSDEGFVTAEEEEKEARECQTSE